MILDGRKLAEKIYLDLQSKVNKLSKKPGLSIVLIGRDDSSRIYVDQKQKAAKKIGINFDLVKKDKSIQQAELEELISKLNQDPSISGIVVQKPLPKQIDSEVIDVLVTPKKDVDGLNPISNFIPATTRGILELLAEYNISVKNKHAVVVGTSKITGLPTALELLEQGAAVTICNSNTKHLAEKTKLADILVVAVGKAKLINANMIKKGAVVIDIGISRSPRTNNQELTTKIVGDVDFSSVSKVASFITPVPGGVGPMTVAALMENLYEASSNIS